MEFIEIERPSRDVIKLSEVYTKCTAHYTQKVIIQFIFGEIGYDDMSM